jgi:chromosome segregation ATPase
MTMSDSALTLPQLQAELDELTTELSTTKAELKTELDELKTELATTKAELKTELSTTKAELKAELATKAELVATKAELKAEIDRLDAKLDHRSEQILAAVRDTAEMIDARQERRLRASLKAQADVLQDKLDTETGARLLEQARLREALEAHIHDDARHVKPRAGSRRAR